MWKNIVQSDRPQTTCGECALHTGYRKLQTQAQNIYYVLLFHFKLVARTRFRVTVSVCCLSYREFGYPAILILNYISVKILEFTNKEILTCDSYKWYSEISLSLISSYTSQPLRNYIICTESACQEFLSTEFKAAIPTKLRWHPTES
jgi:hypothetical protein